MIIDGGLGGVRRAPRDRQDLDPIPWPGRHRRARTTRQPARARRPGARWLGALCGLGLLSGAWVAAPGPAGLAAATLSGAGTPGPEVAAASTDGGGWVTTASGAVSPFGRAAAFGSLDQRLNRPVVGMAATPDGRGYWLVAADGGVFSFGDAGFYGSTGGVHLNRPVVGMAATPDGRGYWLVAADGGVFSFGDAGFYGSLGAGSGSTPVVGMARSADGQGYWLAEGDGAVSGFGDAGPVADIPGKAVAILAEAGSAGYWLVPPEGPPQPSAPLPAGPPSGASPDPGTAAASGPVLGVMEADPTWMAPDRAAGARQAVINLDWARWEPQNGVIDQSYVGSVVAAADAYRSAGWQVAVDVGLQQAPGWVLRLQDGQLVDQDGRTSGTANFEFSAAVRTAAAGYISEVVADMGQVSSYRVGTGDNGEMLYPGATESQWWAFDPNAQGTSAGLPGGVSPSPMPGWIPGTPTWQGAAVTTAEVQAWYDWYLGALVNAQAWEISAYRGAGYAGLLQLLMPGDGATPSLYARRIQDHLAPESYDGYATMNTGAVWWRILDQLPDLSGTIVDITSVGDGSGGPPNNVCQAPDASDSLAQADPWVSGWSDTRWLTYLAHRHGLPVMGENPGNTPAADVAEIAALAKGCGLTTLQWAWDFQANSSSAGFATLAQVDQALAEG